MKVNSLYLATLLAATASSGVLGVSWPKWGSSGNKENNDEKHVVATVINNDSIENIIHKEKRYVLYNSRRLTGECLPICYDPTPSPVSTLPPFSETITEPPEPIVTSPPISNSPTLSPKEPTGEPTKIPIVTPTGTPTKAVTPTGTPTKEPIEEPTGNGIICEDLTQNNNLGYPFSSSMHDPALGNSHWEGCFPPVHQMGTGQSGRDDAIAVFIGGSYTGTWGAEIEGNIVVLGNFDMKQRGPSNLVSAGLGSQITPNKLGECVKVGGWMATERQIEIYFLSPGNSYECAMVSKGEARNRNRFPSWMFDANGFDYKQDANMDLSMYEEQKESLIRKSEYWSTFPQTPGSHARLTGSVFTFLCSPEDVIQVFHVNGQDDLNRGGLSTYLFDRNCYDKTILINVAGTGEYSVRAMRMDWTDASGQWHEGGHGAQSDHDGFDACMNSNILWNFFEGETVSMVGQDEWQGSILVNGNFNFMTIGQSGRTMIVGDVIQNAGGSEFHNFPFRPPKPLPAPECDDFVPSNPVSEPTGASPVPLPTSPVALPTSPDTDAPVSTDPPQADFDPGNFCHNLAEAHGCDPNRRGACAINPGPNGEPSCGVGVPTGYYPDLTRCDAYCWCTGTAAPSNYVIVNVGEYYDHKPGNYHYLEGKFGKDNGDGAYGTNGGIPVHINGGMSYEGTLRPPGTCGPAQYCSGPNDNGFHPWDSCTKFYQCSNGVAHEPQPCGPGTLFNSRTNGCDFPYNVDCEI